MAARREEGETRRQQADRRRVCLLSVSSIRVQFVSAGQAFRRPYPSSPHQADRSVNVSVRCRSQSRPRRWESKPNTERKRQKTEGLVVRSSGGRTAWGRERREEGDSRREDGGRDERPEERERRRLSSSDVPVGSSCCPFSLLLSFKNHSSPSLSARHLLSPPSVSTFP